MQILTAIFTINLSRSLLAWTNTLIRFNQFNSCHRVADLSLSDQFFSCQKRGRNTSFNFNQWNNTKNCFSIFSLRRARTHSTSRNFFLDETVGNYSHTITKFTSFFGTSNTFTKSPTKRFDRVRSSFFSSSRSGEALKNSLARTGRWCASGKLINVSTALFL